MAERSEEAEAEPEAGAQAMDPGAAMAIGLHRGRSRAKADPEFDAFLRDQRRLINLQTEHLHEQRTLVLSRLRWGRYSDRMKALLQTLTLLVGLVIAAGVAVMAWQAHEDHGLVIDAFSVPPDLAQDGLTGEVVATRFLDKLEAMQAETQAERQAATYQNDWGPDIKVEIPETGLSFGELERLLREKLGHVSHVSGEVVRTAAGLALTARLSGHATRTFEGPKSSLDGLAQQAAEDIYRVSQPYRYATYLDEHSRLPEAIAVATDLASNGPASERAWADYKLAQFDLERGNLAAARRDIDEGLLAGGEGVQFVTIVQTTVEAWSGHDQALLDVSRHWDRDQMQLQPGDVPQAVVETTKLVDRAYMAGQTGRYAQSAAGYVELSARPPEIGLAPGFYRLQTAAELALDHDPGAAATILANAATGEDVGFYRNEVQNGWYALPAYQVAAARGDWPAALARLQAVDALIDAQKTAHPVLGLMQPVLVRPLEAQALARIGRLGEARSLISSTPWDCYLCTRVRAQISAAAGDAADAEREFAVAVRQAPSIPFAYAEWAAARLRRGDVEGALALARTAHAREPGFADPLEFWGEALMAKRDYASAARRFAEADKDAPKWGRNHLRWGEALMLSGRYAEARAQYAATNDLDLSKPDRAALDLLLARTATGPLRD